MIDSTPTLQVRSDRRGQMLIIGAVAIGVLLITMVLVMNSFLFAQNIESEGVPPSTENAEEAQQFVETNFGALLIHVNNAESDNPTAAYDANATSASDEALNLTLDTEATVFDVDGPSEMQEGHLIKQTETRTFENRSGDDLEFESGSVRRFQMTVNRNNVSGVHLPDDDIVNDQDNLTDRFHVVVHDDPAGEEWALYPVQSNQSDNVAIITKRPGEDPTVDYAADVDDVTIGVTTGSVDERATGSVDEKHVFSFGEGLGNVSRIEFRNGDDAEGTYTLTAEDASTIDLSEHFYTDPGDGDPYYVETVYSARFDVTYEFVELTYEGQVRVAPCEPAASKCLEYGVIDTDA